MFTSNFFAVVYVMCTQLGFCQLTHIALAFHSCDDPHLPTWKCKSFAPEGTKVFRGKQGTLMSEASSNQLDRDDLRGTERKKVEEDKERLTLPEMRLYPPKVEKEKKYGNAE